MECDASLDAIAQAEHYEREGVTGPLMRSVDLPVRYTKPYAAGGVFLAVPSSSPARHFEDLANQKIGVSPAPASMNFSRKRAFRQYLMPPYCNTEAEIGVVYDVISGIDVSHEAPDKSAS
jgi:hypothetical protein